jgi:hypothetical protein
MGHPFPIPPPDSTTSADVTLVCGLRHRAKDMFDKWACASEMLEIPDRLA